MFVFGISKKECIQVQILISEKIVKSSVHMISKFESVGDLIIFLKNDKKTEGVNNGDTARILSIDDEGNVPARLESSDD